VFEYGHVAVFEYGHSIAIYKPIFFLKLDTDMTDISSIQVENISIFLGLRALDGVRFYLDLLIILL